MKIETKHIEFICDICKENIWTGTDKYEEESKKIFTRPIELNNQKYNVEFHLRASGAATTENRRAHLCLPCHNRLITQAYMYV